MKSQPRARELILVLMLAFPGCSAGNSTADSVVRFDDDGQSGPDETASMEHCVEGMGCLGAPCDNATECPAGWCISHQGEKVCSVPCAGDCPDGWICATVVPGTPAAMEICLSLHPTLCQPCTSSYDCVRTDGLKGYCLDFGDDAMACGALCSTAQPCPDGYDCQVAVTVEGDSLEQCVPVSGSCDGGPPVVDPPVEGDCEITNQWGSCPGQMATMGNGETICMGPTPMDELCNNLDDDCDGEVDEDNCSLCGKPGACEPAATEEEFQECGPCSSSKRSRMCDSSCRWSDWSPWSECSEPGGSGECLPDEMGQEEQACGNCGIQQRTRSCSGECQWGEWSAWGDCTSQGACVANSQETQSEGCGNCGTRTRKRTCNDICEWGSWGDWSSCGGQGVCSPGQTTDGGCDKCAQKSCNSSCQWGGCSLKPGAQCEWKNGTNWECCGSGKWHFCLPSTCKWSTDCSPCSGCGC
jgi:hypothetical protein